MSDESKNERHYRNQALNYLIAVAVMEIAALLFIFCAIIHGTSGQWDKTIIPFIMIAVSFFAHKHFNIKTEWHRSKYFMAINR